MPGVFGAGFVQGMGTMKKKSPKVENASSPQENVGARQVEMKKPNFSVGQDVWIVRSNGAEQNAKVEEYKTDTETVVVSFIDKASGRKATKEIPATELQEWQENKLQSKKFENAEIKRDSMMEKIRGLELQDAQNILFSESAIKNPQMAARAFFKKLYGTSGQERGALIASTLSEIQSRIDAIPVSLTRAYEDIINNKGAFEKYKRMDKLPNGEVTPKEVQQTDEYINSIKLDSIRENAKMVEFYKAYRLYNDATALTKPFKVFALNRARRALQEALTTPTGTRVAFKLTDAMRRDEIDNTEKYHTKKDLGVLDGVSDEDLMKRFENERLKPLNDELFAAQGSLDLVPSYVKFEKQGGNKKIKELDALVAIRQYVEDGRTSNPFVQ